MRSRRVLCIFVSLIVTALSSCGAPDDSNTGSYSDLDYLIGSTGVAGLTRKVAQPVIRICYSDPSNNERHKLDTIDSVMQWVDALRDVANVALAEKVELVSPNAPCDARMTVGNIARAYTRMGSTPAVYINYSGWFGSQTVTLHEFGHAFGLLDTYAGNGGSCRTGQPNSVMCRANYPKLQADDIAGVRAVYAALNGGPRSGLPQVREGTIVY